MTNTKVSLKEGRKSARIHGVISQKKNNVQSQNSGKKNITKKYYSRDDLCWSRDAPYTHTHTHTHTHTQVQISRCQTLTTHTKHHK